jgi:hypothetical protein
VGLLGLVWTILLLQGGLIGVYVLLSLLLIEILNTELRTTLIGEAAFHLN